MAKIEQDIDRLRILNEINQMIVMWHLENDDLLMVKLELANSDLECADEMLMEAYAYCVHMAAAQQLNPPPSVPSMPPPPSTIPCIIIGEDDDGAPAWFYAEEDVFSGVAIIGVTGCGKTVTLARIISCLPPHFFAYLPDSKREVFRIYTALNLPFLYVRPCEMPINLLACPTDAPELYFSGLLEKWAPILPAKDETWPVCAAALATASHIVKSSGPLTVNQASVLAAGLAEASGKDKFGTFSMQMHLLAQILGKNANLQTPPDIAGRYRGLGLDFSGVALKSRHLIEVAIIQQFLQGTLTHGFKKDSCLILIHDEGSDTFSSSVDQGSAGRQKWQDDLLVKSRSLKVGKIILLQFISQGCDSLLSSMRVLIIMRLPDPAQARLAVRYLNLPDEFIPIIQNLPDGEAFLKTPRLNRGLHIRIPNTDLKNYSSDGVIAQRMANEIQWLADNSTYAPPPKTKCGNDDSVATIIARDIYPAAPDHPAIEPEQVNPATLLSDWVEFMTEILANPNATSSQHGRNLNWGNYKLVRIKKEMIEAGLIAVTKQNTAGRPAERLLVTRLGITSLESFKNDKK